jgi:hypothetical protein
MKISAPEVTRYLKLPDARALPSRPLRSVDVSPTVLETLVLGSVTVKRAGAMKHARPRESR